MWLPFFIAKLSLQLTPQTHRSCFLLIRTQKPWWKLGRLFSKQFKLTSARFEHSFGYYVISLKFTMFFFFSSNHPPHYWNFFSSIQPPISSKLQQHQKTDPALPSFLPLSSGSPLALNISSASISRLLPPYHTARHFRSSDQSLRPIYW